MPASITLWQPVIQLEPLGSNNLNDVHKILERTTVNTSELIYIIEGEMRVDFLNDDDKIVGTATLTSGLGMLQFIGGHRITMDAKTKYFELKQGPYFGHIDDKRIVEGQLEHAKAT